MPANAELLPKPKQAAEKVNTSESAERQTFVYDGAGEVRQRLLGAPEWMHGSASVPEGSIAVSINVDDVHENAVLEMSQNVGNLLDGDITSQVGLNDGYRKMGPFTSLSSLEVFSRTSLNRHRKLGEPDKSVVFIYDSQLKPQEETVILPAAMMVKGEVNTEQLKRFREQFPSVPFVNSKNELLDGIGLAERQKAREKREKHMRLGKVAARGNTRLDTSEITPAQRREAFQRFAQNRARARQAFEDSNFSGYADSYKGEQYQSSVPPREGVKIDKTHIPSTEESTKKAWNITPETSAESIAQQAIDQIVPTGATITPEKLNKFSNAVKRALSKERIHPDVDARAKEVYSKVDDELTKRRNESRTTS